MQTSDRTHGDPCLQPERTDLAWGRTALSLVGAAAVFLRWIPITACSWGPSSLWRSSLRQVNNHPQTLMQFKYRARKITGGHIIHCLTRNERSGAHGPGNLHRSVPAAWALTLPFVSLTPPTRSAWCDRPDKKAGAEYGSQRLRINCAGPGYILTPLLEKHLDEEARKGLIAKHPLGRALALLRSCEHGLLPPLGRRLVLNRWLLPCGWRLH